MPGRRHSFRHEGYRLVYDEYGTGPRPLVLLPGLLLNRKMHAPLAKALAERGNRVYVLDYLGHGDSDRPRDMGRCSTIWSSMRWCWPAPRWEPTCRST
jgi:pimeloyl-ACP methyl ester carboxylesterase